MGPQEHRGDALATPWSLATVLDMDVPRSPVHGDGSTHEGGVIPSQRGAAEGDAVVATVPWGGLPLPVPVTVFAPLLVGDRDR